MSNVQIFMIVSILAYTAALIVIRLIWEHKYKKMQEMWFNICSNLIGMMNDYKKGVDSNEDNLHQRGVRGDDN